MRRNGPHLSIAVIWLFAITSAAMAQSNRQPPVFAEQEILPAPQKVEILDLVPNRKPSAIGQNHNGDNGRIDRINGMLTQLRQLAKDRRAKAADPTPQPLRLPPPRIEVAPESASTIAPPAKATLTPAANDVSPPIEPISNARDTSPVSLTSTIDSLALANNLFAQGKTGAAKPIYQKLMGAPRSTSDRVWIQYQLACCHRIDGDIKEATKLYRIVGSSNVEPYWASRAHWWLDYLGRAQKIELRRQDLEKQLEALKKVVHEPQPK